MEVEEEERWRIALAREEKAIGELGGIHSTLQKKTHIKEEKHNPFFHLHV